MYYTYLVSFRIDGGRFISELIKSNIRPSHITEFDIAKSLEKIYAIKFQNFNTITYESK